MKTFVIITEKRTISHAIVKALAPQTFDDRGNCTAHHCDIVTLKTIGERSEISTSDKSPCQVLQHNLKNHRYFYFCQSECKRCNLLAQHLDNMGPKNAGRVRKRIKYVNEHITKDLRIPVVDTLSQLGKCIDFGGLLAFIESREYPQTSVLDGAAEGVGDSLARTLERMREDGFVVEENGMFSLTGNGHNLLQTANVENVIAEDINYYALTLEGDIVIVIDTFGNPYRLGMAHTSNYLQRLVTEARDWQDLASQLTYRPGVESFDPRDLKSHQARALFLNNLLIRRLSPCDVGDVRAGDKLDIGAVFAATDYDIAGSAIVLSVIDNANAFARRIGLSPVRDDSLHRMKLTSMESSAIVDEFRRARPFDWGNAYAGKARVMFDYLYGKTITHQLSHSKTRYLKIHDPQNIRFKVGRTLFLALKRIIQQEARIRNEIEEQYVYLVFEGQHELDGIRRLLAKGAFAALHVRQKRYAVSLSRFLTLCEEDHIGTHTTRYKLIGRLEAGQLVICHDNKILSTPFGNYYLRVLSRVLDSEKSFSIEQWSKRLQAVIDAWRIKAGEREDDVWVGRQVMDKEFEDFMGWLLPDLQAHLRFLGREYHGIVQDLWGGFQRLPYPKVIKKKVHGSYVTPDDAILLIGLESAISEGDVKTLIQTNRCADDYNTPIAGTNCRLIRHIPPHSELPREEYVRRLCCIDREYEFEIVAESALNGIYRLDGDEFTVFRARISGDRDLELVQIIRAGLRVDSYQEMELDESSLEEKDSDTAHEPLMITDVSPKNIAGSDGMLLAQEYLVPWMATYRKLENKKNHIANISSFRSGDLEFERVERYTFGRVHNFESLLVAMLEKYNMPFSRTAKLAEELYLSV